MSAASWSAAAWASLAAALILLPGAAPRPGAAVLRARRDDNGVPLPVLRFATVVALVPACVAALGPVRGSACAALASPAAAWAVGRLHARAGPARADPHLPFCLDLVSAALRAGQPLASALALAAPAASPPTARVLERVAALLRLGAEPADAWQTVDGRPALAPLARVACRSAHSGVRLAGALAALAEDLRAEEAAGALARAQRAGVQAMAPLGACFLPAFLCLGIVPVVIGVARGAFEAVP